MVAFSTVDAAIVSKLLGPIDSRGIGVAQIVPDPSNLKVSIAREFQSNAKKLRDANFDLTQDAMEGYIAAKVLVGGLRRTGQNPTRGQLRLALESLRNFNADGVVINFSPASHSGSSLVNIGILGIGGKLLN